MPEISLGPRVQKEQPWEPQNLERKWRVHVERGVEAGGDGERVFRHTLVLLGPYEHRKRRGGATVIYQ